MLQQQCFGMQLAGYDFQYMGGISGVTSESLISLIAAHFKFDPTTGKDL